MKIKANQKLLELSDQGTPKEAAEKLHLTEPQQAVAVRVNGVLRDFSHPLKEGDELVFWSFDDPEGKEVFWHTSAHVLAQAVLRLWPDAQPTIGPPIEHGFYYDFANLTLSDQDFAKIEKEVEAILASNYKTERLEYASKSAAKAEFSKNPYKVELIEGFDGDISAYRQGEFLDLCRGPHVASLGKIKAFKVLKTSGAYWRGDSKREMLTRIYAISFPDRKQLKEYLQMLEEAKKRDHKILGPALDLFSFKEEAPGMPFIHPHGLIVWNKLIEFLRENLMGDGYIEIKTPAMMSKELWERSGHWFHYKENMYTSTIEEREFAIKPMNCPGCMLFYKTATHSYRELPMRVAEIGHVHRFEASGALNGLFRVRSFHQDDAHLFMTLEQIREEILKLIHLADKIYMTFGLPYKLGLSTRPTDTSKTIGSDEEWDIATAGLRGALDDWGHSYHVNEGDGAFYGPKIDIQIRDALGRFWQCGTIQLDFALPQKFELEYVDNDGSHKRPVMLHRAILGSIERFFGVLVEHFAGKFPFWISPYPVRILTVADRHSPFAHEVAKKIRSAGILCEIDDTNESVGKKIRTAQMLKTNYMLTVGDKEVENKTIALRTRDNVVHGEIDISDFLAKVVKEQREKALMSPFSVAT